MVFELFGATFVVSLIKMAGDTTGLEFENLQHHCSHLPTDRIPRAKTRKLLHREIIELFGATFVVSLIKMAGDTTGLEFADLLNTGKALSVILGIFLSVAIALPAS